MGGIHWSSLLGLSRGSGCGAANRFPVAVGFSHGIADYAFCHLLHGVEPRGLVGADGAPTLRGGLARKNLVVLLG